jgi:hypothetical protein
MRIALKCLASLTGLTLAVSIAERQKLGDSQIKQHRECDFGGDVSRQ